MTETLWWIIYMAGGIKQIVKICNHIQEANHAMQSVIWSNNHWDQNNLPWLLTEQQSNGVKEVIQRIKFPMGFCSNIKNILMKKGEFGRVKTHDWHTFIKVINNFSIHIYILVVYIFWYFYLFLSSFETSNNLFLLLQYVLPLSLPNEFENNVKQVIYDIGKYMR